MPSLFASRPLRALNRLLLVFGLLAVASGWYLYASDNAPASQSALPAEACTATITLSDGSEELLAVPGCEAHYRSSQR